MTILTNAALAALGPALIAASFWLTLEQVEPFVSHIYLFAWYGLIFSFDQLIRRIEGRSLIVTCGPSFALLLFWSAVAWFLFELINLRLENWYYVFLDGSAAHRLVGTVFAFATVFPGIFWIDHYLQLKGTAVGWRGPAIHLTRSSSYWLQCAGTLLMLMAMIWPRYFFAGVWLGVLLIVAPINYRRHVDGILRQLESGSYGPTARLLLSGLLAGGLWEFFNFWARAKWIYTVPFFDELKLFEMPLFGFLGFPPFALECACLYRLLVSWRLAPSFGAFIAADARPPGMWRTPLFTAGLFTTAIVGSLVSFHYMDRHTVASTVPRVGLVEGLNARVRERLTDLGIRHLTQLEGRGSPLLWQHLEENLGADDSRQLRQISGLYLHQGIGTDFGNLLVEAGCRSLEDMGGYAQEPQLLLERMALVAAGRRLPTLAQLEVWLRRLPTRASD